MTGRRFVALAMVMFVLLCTPFAVFAGQPLNLDAKPVQGETPTQQEPGGYDLGATNKEAGYGEKVLIDMTNGLAGWAIAELDEANISIAKLVYGQPGEDGKRVPILFTTDEGNVFGKVSGAIYSLFRGVAALALPMILAVKALEIAQGQGNQGQRKADWKNILTTYAISVLAMFLLPVILPAAIDLRDSILSGLASAAPNGKDLMTTVRDAATADSARLGDSILYLAMVGATLWFGLSYTCIAMGTAVLLAVYPLTCITMNSAKVRIVLNNWCKEAANLYFVPLIDTILLLFPTFAITMAVPDLFTIFMLMLVIPTRTMLRRLFGVGGGGMELAGVGMLMGAMALTRGAVGGVRGLAEAGKEYSHHKSMGEYYGDQAKMDGTDTLANAPANGAAITQASKTSGNVDINDHLGGTFAQAETANGETGTAPMNLGSDEAVLVGGGESGAVAAASTAAVEDMARRTVAGTGDQYAKASWLHHADANKTLSNAKRAELHRKAGRSALARGIGGAGLGLAGAGIGGSLGIFSGPAGIAYGAAIGGQLAGFAGQSASVLGTAFIDTINNQGTSHVNGTVAVGTENNATQEDVTVEMSGAPSVRGERSVGPAVSFSATGAGSAEQPNAPGPRVQVDWSKVNDIARRPPSQEAERTFRSAYNASYKEAVDKATREFANNQRAGMAASGTTITPDIEAQIQRQVSEFSKSAACHSAATAEGHRGEFNKRVEYLKEQAIRELNLTPGNVEIAGMEAILKSQIEEQLNKQTNAQSGYRYDARPTDLDAFNF